MTVLTQYLLQKEIYAQLDGDTPLSSLITGIYDHVPEDSAYPYVVIGEVESEAWGNAARQGMEYRVEIHSFSRERGKKQSAEIMEKVYAILHRATLTINGQMVFSPRFLTSRLTLQNDGLTYHGRMRFRVLTLETE